MRSDPLDVLRAAVAPLAPDPGFASALRRRLEELLGVGVEVARNGARHGDVSYITLGVPDAGAARRFYAAVLGWRFTAGRVHAEHALQVEAVAPMVGVWSPPAGGELPGEGLGAVLAFRVDDLDAAVAAVRREGGTALEPTVEPYGRAAVCTDGEGLGFYLHQLPPADTPPAGPNGSRPGDVSYLTMRVRHPERARAFFGSVLGWRSVPGGHGYQIEGPTPQVGMTDGSPGVTLCYRVDDIAATVERVRAAGGTATEPAARPYALEAYCHDDGGTPFYLHQF